MHTFVCNYARNYAHGLFGVVRKVEHGLKFVHCFSEIRFAHDRVATIDRLTQVAVSFMATLRDTPARSKLRTAVRLKS